MIKKILFTLIISIFLNNIFYSQCNLYDINYIDLITNIQTKIFNEDFDDAIKIIDGKINTEPDKSQYFFIKTIIYYWMNFTYEDNKAVSNLFLKNADKTIEIGNTLLKKKPNDVCNNFIMGSTLGYKGLFYLDNGSTLSAINNASDGIDYLNTVLKLDSSLVDSYYGVGVYNYNAGSANFFIRLILPIFFNSADKEKGINHLEYIFNKGKLANDNAAFSLALIYKKEENYNKSEFYLRYLVKKYSASSIFNVYLMESIFNYSKNYVEVIELGKALLEKDTLKELSKKRMGAMIYWFLAKSSEMVLNYNDALKYMNKYLKIEKDDSDASSSLIYYKNKLRKL